MIAALLCSLLLADPEPPAVNPVYDLLTKVGVRVEGLPDPVRQEAPLLRPGVAPTAAESDAAVQAAAGKWPLKVFTGTGDAPISLAIDPVEDAAGVRRAQTVRVRFMAYGVRNDLAKLDFAGLLSGDKKPNGPKTLTAGELRSRGVAELAGAGQQQERYSYFESSILDAVQLSGVTRAVRTTVGPSTLVAVVLDERFAGDASYPNGWRSVGRLDLGGRLGPRQPYAGLAGYVHAVKLPAPPGAMLVEMRLAFAEPVGWFGGPNQLRSKLPIAIQDHVKTLRRRLAEPPKP